MGQRDRICFFLLPGTAMISALIAASAFATPARLWLGVDHVVVRCTDPADGGVRSRRHLCSAVAAEAAVGAHVTVTEGIVEPADPARGTMLLDVAAWADGEDLIVTMDLHRAVDTGENDRIRLTRTLAPIRLADGAPLAAMLDEILPWRARPIGQRLRRMR